MKLFESNKKLEEAIKRCSDISLPEDKKLRLKRSILQSLSQTRASEEIEIVGFAAMVSKLKQVALELSTPVYFRSLLKEKLQTLAEFKHALVPRVSLFAGLGRKVFAGALGVLFLFTMVVNFAFQVDRVEATLLTTLESVTGDVTIIRQGETLLGVAGFLLKTDDVIRTGEDSKAAIRFLDESVSRLDENTEVKISKLFANPSNKTETIVEVVLNRGQIWSRVISLINNVSRFQVQAGSTVAVAKKKAAFNVSVSSMASGQKAKVTAIKNQIDLTVAADQKIVETTLMNGFVAEMKATPEAAEPVITKESGDKEDAVWVAQNLEEDKLYIADVRQQMKDDLRDHISVMPGNPLYAVKELSESTKIVLTFSDKERKKIMLAQASEKLAAAQIFLERNDRKNADILLREFQAQIKEVLDWVKNIEADYPSESLEIRMQINEILSMYEKKLTIILPDDLLYSMKETISSTKVLATENSVQKTQEKLSQAADKLLEAHDLVEEGENQKAAKQVEAYGQAIEDVVSDVKLLPEEEKEQVVTALIEKRGEDLKVLEAMITPASKAPAPLQPAAALSSGTTTVSTAAEAEVSRAAVSGPALQKTVQDVKTSALTNFGEAVLEVESQQSAQVLQKLEDIEKIEVNGKPLVDFTITRHRMTIKTNGSVISVTGTTTPAAPAVRPAALEPFLIMPPQKASSEAPKLPQVQP